MRQAADDSPEPSQSGPRLRPGDIVGGRFRIDSELACEGGTWIYEASEESGQPGAGGNGNGHRAGGASPWAVRVIPLDRITHGPARLAEAMAQIQFLRHKNLVDIETVGIQAHFLFVVSEKLEGKTLRGFMDGKRAEGVGVSLKGATNLVAHVSNALEHVHHLAPHGALTPAVIWVSSAGRVKVEGLGLSASVPSLARQGFPEGSPETLYVAPEILAGGPPTSAADVYSMGAIFYELLTGQGLARPHRRAGALVPGVPPAVDDAIERALSPAPEHRWPSPGAFKVAPQSAAGGLPANVNAAGTPRPAVASAAAGKPLSDAGFPGPAVGLVPVPAVAVGAGPLPVVPPPVASPVSPVSASVPTGPLVIGSPPVAAVPAEETEERWLIQKGNLDFGPFSLVQIRAQIERGEILAEHNILDNDSGNRCRVRDYPGLGDLVVQAHRRLEKARRDQAEQRSESTQKKKSLVMTGIVTLVVASVFTLVVFYVLSRSDTSGGHLASRQEEAEVDTFLKGVKLGGLKATVRRGGHHGSVASALASGGPGDEFNNDAKFGDASRGMAQGDQTLDDDQIQGTMMANYRKLIPCISRAPGVSEIALDFVVRGTGKVSAVRVNGQKNGALPSCMLGRMQSFTFPKFDGTKTIASWSMSLGR